MILSKELAAWLRCAAAKDLPFAVWTRPESSTPEAVISCSPVMKRSVFTADHKKSGFALNRFSGGVDAADFIDGDIRISTSGVHFFNGTEYQSDPATPLQKDLFDFHNTNAVATTTLQAPVGASLPDQTNEQDYKQLVEKAVQAIQSDEFLKVVLSRAEHKELDPSYDLLTLFSKLATKLPAAFVSLVYLPGQCAWLVGTPEKLLTCDNKTVETVALAGTQWLGENVELRQIGWPDKIIEEQALVCDYIRDAFTASGIDTLKWRGPRSVQAANLVHLRSDFTAQIPESSPKLLQQLLAKLHPTSAVCGMPKPKAAAFLTEHEGYDRDYYTGFLGPVDFNGRTDLFVNLRTSQIIGSTVVLYVGGGIVSDSQPDVEWQETIEKTKTVGSIF